MAKERFHRILSGAGLCAALLICTSAVLAQPAAPAASQQAWSALAGFAIEAAAIIMPVAGAYVLVQLRTWFGMQQEAKDREAFQVALQNAIGLIISRAGSRARELVSDPDFRSAMLKQVGVPYLIDGVPDAINRFGLSDRDLQKKLEAAFGHELPGPTR